MFCHTCKSTLLSYFLETAVLQKSLVVYHPLTNLSFAAVGFLLIIVEAKMEKIVIQVPSSDEDTDTATECSDYSDTESADEEYLC